MTKQYSLNGQDHDAVLKFRSLHQKSTLNKILTEFAAFCCIHTNNI